MVLLSRTGPKSCLKGYVSRGNFHTYELEYLSGKAFFGKYLFFLEAVGMIIGYLFLTRFYTVGIGIRFYRFYTVKPIHTTLTTDSSVVCYGVFSP